jgi:tRNA pseudouridine55 synthase
MTGTGSRHASVWLVDKPAGPTSHDIVASIRRGLPKGIKVGHAGTLDPFATGLLVVLVGAATRLARYLSGLDKGYAATVRLGARSRTGDPEGPITPGEPVPDREAIASAVTGLLAMRSQATPIYSAVKVEGERLYAAAREGREIDAPAREIVIHEAQLRDLSADGHHAQIELRCSSGTYVRQVAADLGETLGCGAYCAALRRTTVGGFSVEHAVPPEAVGLAGGLEPAVALAHLPSRELSAVELVDIGHGRSIGGGRGEATVALVHGGRLISVGRDDGAGVLRPEVVLT